MNLNACSMQLSQQQQSQDLLVNAQSFQPFIDPTALHGYNGQMFSFFNQMSTFPKFAPQNNEKAYVMANDKPKKELGSQRKPKKPRQERCPTYIGQIIGPSSADTKDAGEFPGEARGQFLSQQLSAKWGIQLFEYASPQMQLAGLLMPKLSSDIGQAGQNERQGGKSSGKGAVRKPKKEHINTGHWTQEEHSTYLKFLSQYEDIMASQMMKKTSKIFKQMSELIGSRTPSQCRSHHQKFNPYAIRGVDGKRLPRNERSRAGRKRKITVEATANPPTPLPTEALIDTLRVNAADTVQYFSNPLYLPPSANEVFGMPPEYARSLQEEAVEVPPPPAYQEHFLPLQAPVQYEFMHQRAEEHLTDDLNLHNTFEAFFRSPNLPPRKISADQILGFTLNDPGVKCNEVFQ